MCSKYSPKNGRKQKNNRWVSVIVLKKKHHHHFRTQDLILLLKQLPQYDANQIFPICFIASDKVKNSTLWRASCTPVNMATTIIQSSSPSTSKVYIKNVRCTHYFNEIFKWVESSLWDLWITGTCTYSIQPCVLSNKMILYIESNLFKVSMHPTPLSRMKNMSC